MVTLLVVFIGCSPPAAPVAAWHLGHLEASGAVTPVTTTSASGLLASQATLDLLEITHRALLARAVEQVTDWCLTDDLGGLGPVYFDGTGVAAILGGDSCTEPDPSEAAVAEIDGAVDPSAQDDPAWVCETDSALARGVPDRCALAVEPPEGVDPRLVYPQVSTWRVTAAACEEDAAVETCPFVLERERRDVDPSPLSVLIDVDCTDLPLVCDLQIDLVDPSEASTPTGPSDVPEPASEPDPEPCPDCIPLITAHLDDYDTCFGNASTPCGGLGEAEADACVEQARTDCTHATQPSFQAVKDCLAECPGG